MPAFKLSPDRILILILVLVSFLNAGTDIQISVQEGHQGRYFGNITCTAFSPDGRFLATGSEDRTLKIWEIKSGMVYQSLSFSEIVLSVSFSPDGRSFAVSIKDYQRNSVSLWNSYTGEELRPLQSSVLNHSLIPGRIIFSPDGRYIMEGHASDYQKLPSELKIWEVSSGSLIQTIKSRNISPLTAEFTPDSKNVIMRDDKTELIMYNIASGETVRKFSPKVETPFVPSDPGQNYVISSIRFTPDGKTMAGFGNGVIAEWDLDTGARKLIKSVPFNAGGSRFIPGTGKAVRIDSEICSVYNYDDYYCSTAAEYRTGKDAANSIIGLNGFDVSRDGRFIAVADGSGIPFILETEKMSLYRRFTGYECGKGTVSFSKDGLFAASFSKEAAVYWDMLTGKVIDPEPVRLTPDYFSGAAQVDEVFRSDYDKETLGVRLINKNKGSLYVWFENELDEEALFFQHITTAATPDGRYFILSRKNKIRIVDLDIVRQDNHKKGSEIIKTVKKAHDIDISSITVSDDGKYFATRTYEEIKIWTVPDGKCVQTMKDQFNFSNNGTAFTPDGRYLFTASDDCTITKRDILTGEAAGKFKTHRDRIYRIAFTPDGKYIFTASNDRTFRKTELETGKWVSFVSSPDGTQWAAVNDEGYWDSSLYGGRLLAVIRDNECFGIDQFAYRNNRPDILLTALGCGDTELIGYYRNLYLKRLKRSGLQEEAGTSAVSMPETDITEAEQKNKIMSLRLNFSAGIHDLKNYNIYVNDVALFGSSGREISGKSAEITEKVELTSGPNKIEVSCTDVKGAESYRAVAYADHVNEYVFTGKSSIPGLDNNSTVIGMDGINFASSGDFILNWKKVNKQAFDLLVNNETVSVNVTKNECVQLRSKRGDLYFLAFGVSKYKNKELDLDYADKDALDLERLFMEFKGKAFENVYTKVFVNGQVTPAAVKDSKEFLKNAGPDDTFILFMAGHGVHDTDNEATYYFLTYNTDLKDLRNTAADFDTVEDILHGIQPRKKLFLIDACESGELDADDTVRTLPDSLAANVRSRGLKIAVKPASAGSDEIQKNIIQRSYIFEKDRYIYNNLLRRSGAIVFSSSKGGELSYERDDLKNGLFTSSIIKAFRELSSDPKAGIISVDELRRKVSEHVVSISGGLQHPVIDRDNIYQRFGFNFQDK